LDVCNNELEVTRGKLRELESEKTQMVIAFTCLWLFAVSCFASFQVIALQTVRENLSKSERVRYIAPPRGTIPYFSCRFGTLIIAGRWRLRRIFRGRLTGQLFVLYFFLDIYLVDVLLQAEIAQLRSELEQEETRKHELLEVFVFSVS
jgi:hypothetical protein